MFWDTSYCDFDAASGALHMQFPWIDGGFLIHPWEEHCRVETFSNGEGQDEYYDLPIASGALTGDNPMHPIARFAARIPKSITRIVSQYAHDQLAMVQVCSRSSRGLDILESAPTLFWYLVPYLSSSMAVHSTHDLLGEKRHILLGRLCGRDEPWLVRLITRLQPAAFQARQILGRLLATPHAMETLNHSPNLSWEVLKIAAKYSYLFCCPIGRSLFRENVSVNDIRIAIGRLGDNYLLRDTARLGRQLGITGYESLISSCKTYLQVLRLHERWSERIRNANFTKAVAAKGNDLPPPPLPGTEAIKPITTFYDLFMEGKEMHHCVGAYDEAVRSGNTYIYKVLHPVRSTLEVRFTQGRGWAMGQLKTYCNSDPGTETMRVVRAWLNEH